MLTPKQIKALLPQRTSYCQILLCTNKDLCRLSRPFYWHSNLSSMKANQQVANLLVNNTSESQWSCSGCKVSKVILIFYIKSPNPENPRWPHTTGLEPHQLKTPAPKTQFKTPTQKPQTTINEQKWELMSTNNCSFVSKLSINSTFLFYNEVYIETELLWNVL